MNFIEFCNSIGIENPRTDANDLVNISVLKECWDYREKQIELLERTLLWLEDQWLWAHEDERLDAVKEALEKLKELRS